MKLAPPHGVIRYVAKRYEREQEKLHADARREQATLLARIVARYRDTQLGRTLGLDRVRSVDDFRRLVPVRTGDDFRAFWEPVLESNPPGLLHPKPLKYMGISSGSSGVPKPIPIPADALDAYRRFTNHLFFHAFHELQVFDLFDGHVLVAAGPPVKEVAKSGVMVGFGSGIASLEAPRFARQLVRPSPEIQAIADRDEKLARLADEAIPLDVRAVTGMPNAATAMLEYVLGVARDRGRAASTARELFPNLRIYGYSGMPLDAHRERLLALLGEGVSPYEIYSSTESPIAYQHRFGEPGLLIDISIAYLELVPSDEPGATRIGLPEAEVGRTYDVVVTAWGGVFAYALGDRIRLRSKNPYVMEFAGRTKEEINFAGEKLPLAAFRAGLDAALRRRGEALAPFVVTLAAPREGEASAYEVFLETRLPAGDADALAASTDRALRDSNHLYAMIRDKDELLGPMRITPLPPGTLERALHRERTFGHAKLPEVQRDRAFVPALLAARDASRDGATP